MATQLPTEQELAKGAQMLRAALTEMRTPMFADRMRFYALDLRLKYVALVEAGFTVAQALRIVIERKS